MLLISPFECAAQTADSSNSQKRAKTLINVPVSVADRDGRYLLGLEKKDFSIYQDGIEQKIVSFSTFDEPINIAILLDTSGSTKNSLKEIKEAAADFVDLLNDQDKCLIATFDSHINLLSTLTSDHKTLKDSLNQVKTAEKTGSVLFNAIEQIAQKNFAGVVGRKVIIVLSDGKDFGSSLARNELMNQLEESDVSIYPVFFQTGNGFNKLTIAPDGTLKEGKENKIPKAEKPKKQKKKYSIIIPTRGDLYTEEEAKLLSRVADIEAVNSLKTMSDTTAGRFYQSDALNLSGIFKKIAGELRQLYRLGFHSTNPASDAAAHRIIVKVDRDNAVVRARGKFRAAQLANQ